MYKENSGRDDLNATIELLEHTAVMVKLYTDRRPISSNEDARVKQIAAVAQWFADWYGYWEQNGKSANEFLTRECFEDLQSMLLGTIRLVQEKLKLFPLSSICLFRLNSDVVENIFCSARGICNGNNNNPTYYQYAKCMNTICIGQKIVSKNANAGSKAAMGGAQPYKCYTKQSFRSSQSQDF